MGLRETDHAPVYEFLRGIESRASGGGGDPSSSVAMGSIGYGAGGPSWLDDYKTKRPPAPVELHSAKQPSKPKRSRIWFSR